MSLAIFMTSIMITVKKQRRTSGEGLLLIIAE
jgi:hypothetical protein